jgi:hypothetical protein
MIDNETARVAALSNRVPTAVLVLEVLAVSLAAVLVAFLLLVTADLDRPTRGMIQVPDTTLREELKSMAKPPAATAPRSP